MMKDKRILVTGGAGFIGSHLCRRLLQLGNEVICLDNYYTGSKANIADLRQYPQFELIRQDVVSPLSFEVDEIYNLACPASPIHYQFNALKTIQTSVLGAFHVLQLAQAVKAKVLQASTSEVYGDPLFTPQQESYWGNVNPIGIRSCYDEGKRCAETIFFDFHRQFGIDIKVVRIFNTYGPYMHPQDGRVVSNFIVQALSGNDITIYGQGNQTRSFCYIDDLVEGLIAMMAAEPSCIGPINLGNPIEFTILELADLVLELTGSCSKKVFKPLPEDDPRQRKPDIDKAKSMLNWQPKISLRDGLIPTIAYFRKLLQL